MIEDSIKTQNNKENKSYAWVDFGSRQSASQLNLLVCYNVFLGLYFGLDHFSHFIWGTKTPVIVLTDKKSITPFSKQNLFHQLLTYQVLEPTELIF